MDRPFATRPRPKPLYTIGDGHYILDLDPVKIQFEVSQVRRDRNDELRGNLAVRGSIAGALELDDEGTIWHEDGVNLSNPFRRKQLALDLARRSKLDGKDFDWHEQLDRLCFEVRKAESIGEPAVYLGDIPIPADTDRIIEIDGFPLLAQHPMILFGDGGTLKSYFALHLTGGLAQREIVTLYADWELSGADHHLRAKRLYGTSLPSIVYMRCTRPLIYEIDRIARMKHLFGAGYLICDSIGVAAHGKLEDSDTATNYYRAVRSLNIGSLHIAHITKHSDQSEYRPFGSAFWHNLARATWFAKAEDHMPDATGRTVALIQRKITIDKPHSALGYRFEFGLDTLCVRRTDPTSIPALAESLPIWQRIKAVISHGPLSFTEIAEETGIKADTVRRTVSRRTGLFLVREGANGAKTVALIERKYGG